MLETIIKGGGMMVPLMVLSVLAMAVALDRWLAFSRNERVDSRSLRSKVLDLLAAGKVNEAGVLCSNTPGPVSAVMLALPLTSKLTCLADIPSRSASSAWVQPRSPKASSIVAPGGDTQLGRKGSALVMVVSNLNHVYGGHCRPVGRAVCEHRPGIRRLQDQPATAV